jgi:hypothetical protein
MPTLTIPRELALAALVRWGYFPELGPLPAPDDQAAWANLVGQAQGLITDERFEDAVARFQQFHGLAVDGWLGPKTAHQMTNPLRCALPDFMADAGCAWPMKRVTWGAQIRLPGISAEQALSAYDEACKQWNAVCGIQLVKAVQGERINIVARSGTGPSNQFDGPGGTLAWSYLPCNTQPTSQLAQMYDEAESWSYRMAVAVCCHELGHAIGLGHLSAGNLLAPYYSPNITKPQQGDIAEVVARYGQPSEPPSPPVPPTPDGAPEAKVTVSWGGKVWEAEGKMRAVS